MKKAVFLLFLSVAYGHLCLFKPMQRGGATVTGPGSQSCYNLDSDGPCGSSAAPSGPIDSWTTGTSMDILFQQNLNHYVIGNPGYIEFSWAVGPNPDESNFTSISMIPDFWAHGVQTQTNISIAIHVPVFECQWCVVRVKYHPWNTPHSPSFVQCTDVAFVPPTKVFTSTIFYYALASLRGIGTPSTLVRLSASGEIRDLAPAGGVFKRSINDKRQTTFDHYFADGIVAANSSLGYLWFLGDTTDNWALGQAPRELFTFNIENNEFENPPLEFIPEGDHWVAFLSGESEFDFLAVDSYTDQAGNVVFSIYGIYDGYIGEALGKTSPNSEYTEFLYADYDSTTNQVYILATGQGALSLWTVALNGSAYNYDVKLDTSAFPVQSFYVDDDGVLYAFSPGASYNTTNYFVSIDPIQGVLTEVAAVQENVLPDFKGTVYGDHKFAHKFFTQTDGATLLVMVDSYTKEVSSTNIETGINNAYKFQSIVGVVTTF